ncbi:hypothetical protein SASPL_104390 [Salvia splendens]|uniref:Uncharacterized protein n=1 Tax=Salvia splendens TaxID=180675 RepID=A0A8X8YHG0_SALSN|nr:hypothetical protein SASPL_104390 [Salvia splendens]
MFGGSEASCDGSCSKQEGIACSFHDQKFSGMINDQKPFNSDVQLQCDVEQVKQLISNNHDESNEIRLLKLKLPWGRRRSCALSKVEDDVFRQRSVDCRWVLMIRVSF